MAQASTSDSTSARSQSLTSASSLSSRNVAGSKTSSSCPPSIIASCTTVQASGRKGPERLDAFHGRLQVDGEIEEQSSELLVRGLFGHFLLAIAYTMSGSSIPAYVAFDHARRNV